MQKLHLGARVPSEGARLVAQWVGREFDGNLDRAGAAVKSSSGMLQRVIDGGIEPGMLLGRELHRCCGVNARDFKREARVGWFGIPDSDTPRKAAA